ncbi:MAG: tetratricopeptide repeat protein [Candidatus Omnitrophica bacterium]|nr:tetratricopeptide repeat protein [Candidatus Omnitrophota bacterium]
MKKINLKFDQTIRTLCLCVFFSGTLLSNVFAQNTDVVEVETDIGLDQLRLSSQINKPVIKSRANPEVKSTNRFKNEAAKERAAKAESSIKADKPQTIDDKSKVSKAAAKSDAAESLSTDVDTISQDVVHEVLPMSEKLIPDVLPENAITDNQVVQINASLRKLIEENKELQKNISNLDDELKIMRGQQKLESNRISEVAIERDALRKQNEAIIASGSRAEQNLRDVQQQLIEKERDYNFRILQLQTDLANALQNKTAASPDDADAGVNSQLDALPVTSQSNRSIAVDVVSSPTTQTAQKRAESVLLALNNMTKEKQKLANDEAKLHYNMGNTFFNQGHYYKAVREYENALALTPEDASAHYNLAFVSGEFLNDARTALTHYKQYLFLNPNAEDAQRVRQKIIEAEISVRADIGFRSKITEETRKKKNEVNEFR